MNSFSKDFLAVLAILAGIGIFLQRSERYLVTEFELTSKIVFELAAISLEIFNVLSLYRHEKKNYYKLNSAYSLKNLKRYLWKEELAVLPRDHVNLM